MPQVYSQAFSDRVDAGRQLAAAMVDYRDRDDVLILALPRGGVPIAYQLATFLRVPFDVFVVRKLGLPGHEELAMGAIASGGVRVVNDEVVGPLGIPATVIDSVAVSEQIELERREHLYRGNRAPIGLANKTVIIVDDGLATGSTMRAAVVAAKQQQPARVIVAVPVGAPATCKELAREADDVVCLMMPEPFVAVGLWYKDFSPTSDHDVQRLLRRPS